MQNTTSVYNLTKELHIDKHVDSGPFVFLFKNKEYNVHTDCYSFQLKCFFCVTERLYFKLLCVWLQKQG